jgi:hypothetical protein
VPPTTLSRLLDESSELLVARVESVLEVEEALLDASRYEVTPNPGLLSISLTVLANIIPRTAPCGNTLLAYGWEEGQEPVANGGPAASPGAFDVYSAGEVSMFFLRCEDGYYRPVYDLIRSRVPVTTGTAWEFLSAQDSLDVKGRIARILLEPGGDFSGEDFAPSFAVRYGVMIVGYFKTLQVINDVLRGKPRDFALSICRACGDNGIVGVGGCFENLSANSMPLSSFDKESGAGPADVSLVRGVAAEEELFRALQGDTLDRWVLKTMPKWAEKSDYLRMLSIHPRAVVSARALSALRALE